MKKLIILLVAVLVTANAYAVVEPPSGPGGSDQTGAFSSGILCHPTMTMTSSNGSSPFTPVFLGNFMAPSADQEYEDHLLTSTEYFLQWEIRGPQKDLNGNDIIYNIQTTQTTDDGKGASISVNWRCWYQSVSGTNVNGGSNPVNGDIKLRMNGSPDNCHAYARFKIISLLLTVYNDVDLSNPIHSFPITISATCQI